MKGKIGFLYAVVAYAVGFASLMLWIIFTGNLWEAFSIDSRSAEMALLPAVLKNLGLVTLFGLQHSVMARQSFKKWLTQFIPVHLERSTYVLVTGILLTFVLWQWEPIGGTIWSVAAGTAGYYVLYGLFFLGWALLFVSSFLINHFDLFGLRQAYLHMVGKPYKPLRFKVIFLYKATRHPLYLGIVLGIWCTPVMTLTHLLFAVLLTFYVLIGIYYEEKDLMRDFGKDYQVYKRRVPKLIPLTKLPGGNQKTKQAAESIGKTSIS